MAAVFMAGERTMDATMKRWGEMTSPEKAVLALGGVVFLAHVLASMLGPYGFFRDELYFIDCGRHPSFGYVDQPPLIPMLAAASMLFGRTLLVLRALPALAHAGTVIVAGAMAARVARSLGEREDVARVVAGASVALAPMYLGLHSTLDTTSFEPLAWTFMAYAAARASLGGERRWLVSLGIVAGIAMEAKYAAPFFLAPLVAGIALGPSRRIVWTREASAGVAAAVALAMPSVAWQLGHGLPFRELLHAASHGKNTVVPPGPFLLNQLLVMNPLLAPLWIAGVGWALFARRLAPVRFLAIAFVGVLLEMMLMHGKDYYVAPAYGVAFALGGVFAARVVRTRGTSALGAWFALVVALTVVAIPTSMPVLPPASLARFVVATHTQPQAQENKQRGAVLPQLMADMVGWRELEATVADVWRALPADERARTTIIAGNYGEAGALDLYGADDGLPPARSGHNQYYLWGPGDDEPLVILRVGGDPDRWKDRCDELTIPARFGADYVMPYEHDRPILQCRHPRFSLRADWPDFKHYE
ncbi:MAG TPA: glycosyltransferase family 39 protein [Polyangiaceae bacterium]